MADAAMLASVKTSIGIEGDYQDGAVGEWIDEVVAFLKDAGVSASNITPGVVSRGVSDLWNYGEGNGKLSEYFIQRAAQLALK
ncbi:MAG: hypothetical protein IJG86_00130 [Clostridia bacterium]|nr:hypothetical protein [Clostridia bacterium]